MRGQWCGGYCVCQHFVRSSKAGMRGYFCACFGAPYFPHFSKAGLVRSGNPGLLRLPQRRKLAGEGNRCRRTQRAWSLPSETLLRVFSKFIDSESLLSIAVELVESDTIDFEKAQLAIEELGRAGIKSYIDDFGTGYSSIVARLAVHGVKLDRSFAMSPPDSVLGRMLVQVIDMIKTSGHLIVVEGVETEARLNLLRSTGVVDYVQRYVLSRPLGIDEFVAFLRVHGMTGGDQQLAA
jgi:hypothetical protein